MPGPDLYNLQEYNKDQMDQLQWSEAFLFKEHIQG